MGAENHSIEESFRVDSDGFEDADTEWGNAVRCLLFAFKSCCYAYLNVACSFFVVITCVTEHCWNQQNG